MSSKRRLRKRACEGKRRHATLDAALKHLAWSRSINADFIDVVPYACEFCSGYHAGHRPGHRGAGHADRSRGLNKWRA